MYIELVVREAAYISEFLILSPSTFYVLDKIYNTVVERLSFGGRQILLKFLLFCFIHPSMHIYL